MNVAKPGSARREIAKATRDAHQSLHTHVWIARLTQSPLNLNEYRMLLAAYYQFFSTVEQAREQCGAYEVLSLGTSVKALRRDLEILDAVPYGPAFLPNALDTEIKVLGALYVLHGAGFGGRQMNANIRRELPDAPRYYFEQTTQSAVWQHLIRTLDATCVDLDTQQHLIASATETFTDFGTFVTAWCTGPNAKKAARA